MTMRKAYAMRRLLTNAPHGHYQAARSCLREKHTVAWVLTPSAA
jgi:hypothetical protein